MAASDKPVLKWHGYLILVGKNDWDSCALLVPKKALRKLGLMMSFFTLARTSNNDSHNLFKKRHHQAKHPSNIFWHFLFRHSFRKIEQVPKVEKRTFAHLRTSVSRSVKVHQYFFTWSRDLRLLCISRQYSNPECNLSTMKIELTFG